MTKVEKFMPPRDKKESLKSAESWEEITRKKILLLKDLISFFFGMRCLEKVGHFTPWSRI